MTKPAKLPRIDQATMRRALRLLNMQYRPSEIAAELKINVQILYRGWLPAGCPHVKDEHGNIWIAGNELHTWMIAVSASRAETKGKGSASNG